MSEPKTYSSSKLKVVAIVGMTASGKSYLGMEIAKAYDGELLSVDSRQVYKEMDIGTNKEPGEIISIRQIPEVMPKGDCPISLSDVLNHPYIVNGLLHYMISIVNPDQVFTQAHFQKLAFGVIDFILKKKKLPILVGGTSLYTTSILDNWVLADTPPDPAFRQKIQSMNDEELLQLLVELDPEAASTIDMHNRRRMQRAIEIAKDYGSVKAKPKKQPSRYEVLYLAPKVDRQVVYQRINERVDKMIENGWLEEIEYIGKTYGWDTVAMTGHGYRQLAEYINGNTTLEKAVYETKKVTRHYAKRQLTWWRKYGDVQWVKDFAEAKKLIDSFLQEENS